MSPLRCAQRRELDARDGEPMEEVVAEDARLHFVVEIAARRREHADVELEQPLPPHSPHLGPLDGAKQLGLERRLEIALSRR